jgi:hypothetical protein
MVRKPDYQRNFIVEARYEEVIHFSNGFLICLDMELQILSYNRMLMSMFQVF